MGYFNSTGVRVILDPCDFNSRGAKGRKEREERGRTKEGKREKEREKKKKKKEEDEKRQRERARTGNNRERGRAHQSAVPASQSHTLPPPFFPPGRVCLQQTLYTTQMTERKGNRNQAVNQSISQLCRHQPSAVEKRMQAKYMADALWSAMLSSYSYTHHT